MTQQLETWEGEFGDAYTDRNRIDWHARLDAFRYMLGGLKLQQVLEVGCNRGHNLLAVAEILGDGTDIVGIDPNRHALPIARGSSVHISALFGSSFDIPFVDATFDLVFTAGVLIHIRLGDLEAALREIYRVARRYVLAIEYFAEVETPISYRGRTDLLWKRNFKQHYVTHFPELGLVREGYWGPEDGFDCTHWWLFEKEQLA